MTGLKSAWFITVRVELHESLASIREDNVILFAASPRPSRFSVWDGFQVFCCGHKWDHTALVTEGKKLANFKDAASGRGNTLRPPDSLAKAREQVSPDPRSRQRAREHKTDAGIPLAFESKCQTLHWPTSAGYSSLPYENHCAKLQTWAQISQVTIWETKKVNKMSFWGE